MRARGRRLLAALGVVLVVAVVAWLLSLLAGALHEPGPEPGPEPAAASRGARPRLRLKMKADGRMRERVDPPPPAATTPVGTTNPDVPKGLGRVSGHILGTSRDLEKAGTQLTVLHPTGARVAWTRTDEDGYYQFERLPHDVPLLIRVERSGYLTGLLANVRLRPYESATKDALLREAPRVVVTLDGDRNSFDALQGVPVQLVRDGRVVDRAVVDDEARRRRDADRDLHWNQVALYAPGFGGYEVRTGSNGNYAPARARRIVFVAGAGDLELEIPLQDGGDIEVFVSDESGGKVAGATVTLGADGLMPITEGTDREGRALFTNVTPGTRLDVFAQKPESSLIGHARIAARPGFVERVLVDVLESHALSLRVLDPDAHPVSGVLAEVRVAGGGFVARGRSDEAGLLTIRGLPAGPADVTLEPLSMKRHVMGLDTSAPAGSLETHTVTLARPDVAVVNGVVRDDAGKCVPGARVRALPSRRQTVAGEDGVFRFSHLPAGEEQTIHARADDHRMAPGSAPTVVPRAGRDVGVEVLMMRRPGAGSGEGGSQIEYRGVHGVVKSSSGEPVVGARIHVGGEETVTDSEGEYDIARARFVRRGRYATATLEVLPPPGLLTAEFVDLDVGSTPVVIAPEVHLRARPFALVRLQPHETVKRTRDGAFSIVSEMSDLAAGRRVAAFEEIECITYDDHWPLLPPMDEWRTRGAAHFAVVAPSLGGPVVERVQWRMRPDDEPVFIVTFADRVVQSWIDMSSRARRGTLEASLSSSPEDVWLTAASDGTKSEDRIDPLTRTTVYRALHDPMTRKRKRRSIARGAWVYWVHAGKEEDTVLARGTFEANGRTIRIR